MAKGALSHRLRLVLPLLLLASSAQAKTVHYELTISQTPVNLSGKETVDFALTVNGGIPAPTLEFTEGDDAEILVKNRVPGQEVSLHWHGILLPPEEDGVAYVNTPPIFSGKERTFRFKIRQSGTYWYHSHTDVQEQKGVYGAFIIHPKQETIKADREVVAVLSDWSDENATSILKNLRKDGDYYLYKKGTMRSWLGGIQAKSLGNFLRNEWTRMGGMDYSDVGYDAFLINGKRELQLADARPGEKVRLRIINAAASTYFNVALGQAPMKAISADGVDIQPILAKELLMGMAETYDVLFEIPEQKNYELKITAQDGTGSASAWIGSGEKVFAPVKPFPDMYATMDHGAHGNHHEHMAHHDHGKAPRAVDTLTVDELRAERTTDFPKNTRVHELKLVLGGDMSRYIWHINGKAIHQDRTIEINEGDVIRIVYENTTMMHHPMHLHGHFFRVLNKHGGYSPLKHTVDVPPHGTRVTEFLANEPGEWMLHCHNLYHMKTGMARVIRHASYVPKPEIAHWQKHDHHLHDHVYFYGRAEAATNHAQGDLRLSRTWDELDARIEARNSAGKNFSFNEEWEIEGDLFYRRWHDRYLNFFGGGTKFSDRYSAVAGIGYILPFLIRTQAMVSHRGNFRLDVDKRFQWTKNVFTDADVTWRPNQPNEFGHSVEYEISLMYSPNWSWAAGLMLTDHNIGAGVQVQF